MKRFKKLLAVVVLLLTLPLVKIYAQDEATTGAGEEGTPLPLGPLLWHECVATLGRDLGRSEKELYTILNAFMTGTVNENSDFVMLAVALAAVESNFLPYVQSPSSGATGLMQVTEIGAIEAERQCPHLLATRRSRAGLRLLADPVTNVQYGTCLLQHYLDEVRGNTFLALVLYNGGYRQLTRLRDNATLTTETREYVFRVHQQLRRCQQ